jgi:metal transporter CNNM
VSIPRTAICVKYGLAIGSASSPFVLALMYLEWPIAYPIAKLLDYILGEEQGTTYRKAELKTFVALHRRASILWRASSPGLIRTPRARR